MGGLRVNGMTRSDRWLSRQGRKMAATTSGSSKQKVQPGDDKGSALTTPGADDTAPDDHGGVLAGHGADDPATHDIAPDDHGGVLAGHGADDPATHDTAPDDHG